MKRVLITGGSGFIGRSLVRELLARGDHVTVFTRNVNKTRRHMPGAVRIAAWTPNKIGPWVDELSVVDAVVHLAGEPVAQRWSDKVKRAIEESRITSTRVIAEGIAQAKTKPGAFVCASAIGYYGPRPASEDLDESGSPGSDWLAGVVTRWEDAAREVEKHGVRSVQVRIGVVLGEGGGALEKMVTPFNMYAGGPLGDGKQVISWVHRDDVVGMILLAIDNETVTGPINAVSPNPATGDEVAEGLGIVLGKPSWLRVPEGVIKIMMGEAAQVVTTGQRVYPRRAVDLGYEFRYARLVPALESILGPDK
ncbi:MAG TPA: TIGR01777 family oxidoreductase [Polyangiaceae bacterium]|nr:TIGR01777 family oxidoreductase [Polyangiaceae bacterium]